VAEEEPLRVEPALGLIARVAEALQPNHAAEVIHLDLKPSDIIFTAEGPKVIDFGIARAADVTSVTGTGIRIGTPVYMAPEYIRGQDVTEADDVFALGVVACFAASGRLAFGGGTTQRGVPHHGASSRPTAARSPYGPSPPHPPPPSLLWSAGVYPGSGSAAGRQLSTAVTGWRDRRGPARVFGYRVRPCGGGVGPYKDGERSLARVADHRFCIRFWADRT